MLSKMNLYLCSTVLFVQDNSLGGQRLQQTTTYDWLHAQSSTVPFCRFCASIAGIHYQITPHKKQHRQRTTLSLAIHCGSTNYYCNSREQSSCGDWRHTQKQTAARSRS